MSEQQSEQPQAEQPQPEAPKPEPGVPLGDNAPTLAELQHQLCPNCGVGVLQIVTYDPHGTFEQGQGDALAKGNEAGGGYSVLCGHCQYGESRAFNPGEKHVASGSAA